MDSYKKSNKIRDIVRLQQLLKKWRNQVNSSKTLNNSNSTTMTNTSIKFLKKTLSFKESSVSETSSNVVPKGYLAVCVGEELKRFIIPTQHLGHCAFQILLREAEEEFGFQQTGVLRIPCEVDVFKRILRLVEGKQDMLFMPECRFDMNSNLLTSRSTPQHPQSPMAYSFSVFFSQPRFSFSFLECGLCKTNCRRKFRFSY